MVETAERLIDLSDTGLSETELFAKVPQDTAAVEKIDAPRYSYWRSVWRVFFSKKLNVIVLALLAIVLVFTYIYPMFYTYNKFENLMDPTAKHLTPAAAIEKFGFHIRWIFGTGESGQPTFDAIWYGARISISIAILCTLISYTIGVVAGALWGFAKRLDIVMNEVRNVLSVVPGTLITSVMVLTFSPSFGTLVFAMCITGWINVAYSLRTQVIIIRDREYNLASKCLGSSTFHIATRNILPYMISYIVTLMAASIPGYIGTEAFLSYIGLGISETTLGKIINTAQGALTVPGWEWEFWCPVLLSAFISIVLFLMGQGLGDAADPRTHM